MDISSQINTILPLIEQKIDSQATEYSSAMQTFKDWFTSQSEINSNEIVKRFCEKFENRFQELCESVKVVEATLDNAKQKEVIGTAANNNVLVNCEGDVRPSKFLPKFTGCSPILKRKFREDPDDFDRTIKSNDIWDAFDSTRVESVKHQDEAKDASDVTTFFEDNDKISNNDSEKLEKEGGDDNESSDSSDNSFDEPVELNTSSSNPDVDS